MDDQPVMSSDVENDLSPSSASFGDLRRVIDSEHREYMHRRQILSTLSASTIRRHRSQKFTSPRLFKSEQELLHQLVAVSSMYLSEGCGCTQGEAHFASALMAVAAIESLIVFGLIYCKKQTRNSIVFKKLWKTRIAKAKKKGERRPLFAQFLVSLRLEEQLRIARDLRFYNQSECPRHVIDALMERGYSGETALARFVIWSRNCIHTKSCIKANENYAKCLDVMYSLEDMRSFHVDFALCAWELHGQIAANLPGKSRKRMR